jgi:hypothetical protein
MRDTLPLADVRPPTDMYNNDYCVSLTRIRIETLPGRGGFDAQWRIQEGATQAATPPPSGLAYA